MALDGGRRGDRRGDEVRTTASTLAALEVSVGRRGTALTDFKLIGIHTEAHGTTRLAPFETGVKEDLVETFRFGLLFYPMRARNNERANTAGDTLPFDHRGRGAEVFDARIGARANKDHVHLDIANGRARREAHVGE